MTRAGQMDANPLFGRSMTGLTAHSVRNVVAGPLLVFGYVVAMAVEADRGADGIRQAQIMGDLYRALLFQDFISLTVLVGPFVSFSRPDQVFVLSNRGTLWAFDGSVTVVAGTSSDAEMVAFVVLHLGAGTS